MSGCRVVRVWLVEQRDQAFDARFQLASKSDLAGPRNILVIVIPAGPHQPSSVTLGAILGFSWAGAILGPFGAILRPFGGPYWGQIGTILGPSWSRKRTQHVCVFKFCPLFAKNIGNLIFFNAFGPCWGWTLGLGCLCGHFWATLGPRAIVGPSMGHLGANLGPTWTVTLLFFISK